MGSSRQGRKKRYERQLSQMVASPTAGSRLVGIEGLRGIAALSVLLAHVHIHLASSVELGVLKPAIAALGQGLTLFFALSGFLLYRPWVAFCLEGKAYPVTRQFLANRVLRIYPAYIVILLLVSLVFGVAYTESIPAGKSVEAAKSTVGFMADPVLMLLNLTLVHTLIPMSIKTGLGVSWSLTVEVAFYLVLPMLGILLLAFARQRGVRPGRGRLLVFIPPLILLITGLIGKLILNRLVGAVGPAEEFYLNWGANWTAVFARSLVVHADLFSFGMMAAVLVSWERSGKMTQVSRSALVWISSAIFVSSIIAAKATAFDDTFFALASAALIVLVCVRSNRAAPNTLARVLDCYPLRFMGLISYSLYLWHIPVIWLVTKANMPFSAEGWWVRAAIVFVVSSLLATLTYFLVEVPALRLKKRTTTQEAPVMRRNHDISAPMPTSESRRL